MFRVPYEAYQAGERKKKTWATSKKADPELLKGALTYEDLSSTG